MADYISPVCEKLLLLTEKALLAGSNNGFEDYTDKGDNSNINGWL